jgi:hypothetical protein
VLRDNERTIVPKSDLDKDGANAPIPRQDADFFAAIRDGREPAISARSVRPAMAALQAAQDSLDARLAELGADARHPQRP